MPSEVDIDRVMRQVHRKCHGFVAHETQVLRALADFDTHVTSRRPEHVATAHKFTVLLIVAGRVTVLFGAVERHDKVDVPGRWNNIFEETEAVFSGFLSEAHGVVSECAVVRQVSGYLADCVAQVD